MPDPMKPANDQFEFPSIDGKPMHERLAVEAHHLMLECRGACAAFSFVFYQLPDGTFRIAAGAANNGVDITTLWAVLHDLTGRLDTAEFTPMDKGPASGGPSRQN